METPITCSEAASKYYGCNIRVKRDDLYPFVGGGNKARKIERILKGTELSLNNAVVTNGGVQSNHARVVALNAAERGWRCKLVLHTNDGKEPSDLLGNLLLMRMAGAEITFATVQDIAQAIELGMEELRAEGWNPLCIPGGGHCLAGALAYTDAIAEVKAQCRRSEWYPEFIVHASGTGATQAGLTAGCRVHGLSTRVIGVSVAREAKRGAVEVNNALKEVSRYLGCEMDSGDVEFLDKWTFGGYEKTEGALIELIRMAARKFGLILDPTYSGKAFFGLEKLIEETRIPPGSRILFWHTGGLPNLLACDQELRVRLS